MQTSSMWCLLRSATRVCRRGVGVAACVLACAAPSASAGSEWQLQKDKNGVAIFTRDVEGSPFLAVKATAAFRQPVEKLAEYLGDGSECMQWRKMCKSSRVLQVNSEDERLVYQVLDLPWPIADRDMVIQSVTEIDPASRSVTVRIETQSDAYPLQKYTRAETSSQIQLRAIDAENAEFTYIIHVDLGGDVSPALVNSQLVSSTLEDVERLLAMAGQ
ncbi:MAG: START domain-containing protein [Halioglobus sp.]